MARAPPIVDVLNLPQDDIVSFSLTRARLNPGGEWDRVMAAITQMLTGNGNPFHGVPTTYFDEANPVIRITVCENGDHSSPYCSILYVYRATTLCYSFFPFIGSPLHHNPYSPYEPVHGIFDEYTYWTSPAAIDVLNTPIGPGAIFQALQDLGPSTSDRWPRALGILKLHFIEAPKSEWLMNKIRQVFVEAAALNLEGFYSFTRLPGVRVLSLSCWFPVWSALLDWHHSGTFSLSQFCRDILDISTSEAALGTYRFLFGGVGRVEFLLQIDSVVNNVPSDLAALVLSSL